MNITQEKCGFAPVVITLETLGEVALFASALAHTGTARERPRATLKYGPHVAAAVAGVSGDPLYHAYDKLDDIARAG